MTNDAKSRKNLSTYETIHVSDTAQVATPTEDIDSHVKALEQRIADMQNTLDKKEGEAAKQLEAAVSQAKRDFISIFGLFASVVTFLTVQIQIFQGVKRFSLMIGTSLTLAASLILFSVVLHAVANSNDDWLTLRNHSLRIVILLAGVAITAFAWAAFVRPGENAMDLISRLL